MKDLLAEIERLNYVHDVALILPSGKLLGGKNATLSERQQMFWKGVLSILSKPPAAEFLFDSGGFLLCKTPIGAIVLSFSGDDSILADLRSRCADVQSALAHIQTRRGVLLGFLSRCGDHNTLHIIRELAQFTDKEVVLRFLHLLQRLEEIDEPFRDEIVLEIVQILGGCPYPGVADALQTFLQRYRKSRAFNSENERAILVSLRQLELEKNGVAEEKEDADEEEGSIDNESAAKNGQKTSPAFPQKKVNSAEERRIQALIAEGKTREAGAALLGIIEKAAKQKKFDAAEKLREKLIEIDSMMLKEIIQAAEIIEQEKIASISPEHLQTWEVLVEMLNREEFSTLYHALAYRHYRNGEIIVQQGAFVSQLFFIHSGRAQVYITINGREIPLTILEAGSVIGRDTFFESSVWTMSVRSMGVEVSTLSKDKLTVLQEKYPGLESKLIDFCALFISPRALFRRTGKSRRKFERRPIRGRASVALLDNEKTKTGATVKGEMFEMSRGGLSFSLNISKKRKARMLFGRWVEIALPVSTGGRNLLCMGRIVAVRGHHIVNNEYSIHVEFERVIEQNEFLSFVGSASLVRGEQC